MQPWSAGGGATAVFAISGLRGGVSATADTMRWMSSPLTSSSAAAPATAKKADKSVMIMNYAFSPASLTVEVGDTVTWTNMDMAPHTVRRA